MHTPCGRPVPGLLPPAPHRPQLRACSPPPSSPLLFSCLVPIQLVGTLAGQDYYTVPRPERASSHPRASSWMPPPSESSHRACRESLRCQFLTIRDITTSAPAPIRCDHGPSPCLPSLHGSLCFPAFFLFPSVSMTPCPHARPMAPYHLTCLSNKCHQKPPETPSPLARP